MVRLPESSSTRSPRGVTVAVTRLPFGGKFSSSRATSPIVSARLMSISEVAVPFEMVMLPEETPPPRWRSANRVSCRRIGLRSTEPTTRFEMPPKMESPVTFVANSKSVSA